MNEDKFQNKTEDLDKLDNWIEKSRKDSEFVKKLEKFIEEESTAIN
ncbi:hypothetical protein HY449_03900 [Candidatus Pacearchaeota archaeon]|nr:hypothetical protein [Candidatus Pacearchaeota archaeon]